MRENLKCPFSAVPRISEIGVTVYALLQNNLWERQCAAISSAKRKLLSINIPDTTYFFSVGGKIK